jgi:hypothetical protein
MKYILIILTLSISIQAQQFDGDKDYFYTVKSSEYELVDTLVLYNSEGKRPTMYTSSWEFNARNTIKRYSSLEIPVMQTDSTVLLKMPVNGYLSELGHVPYPQLNFSMESGDSIYIEQSYIKYGDNYQRDSINIRGYIKKVDYEEKLVNDKVVKTWTLEAYNSDNLDYRATYIYSSEYGFVNFKYYLAGKEVEIDHYTTYHNVSILGN